MRAITQAHACSLGLGAIARAHSCSLALGAIACVRGRCPWRRWGQRPVVHNVHLPSWRVLPSWRLPSLHVLPSLRLPFSDVLPSLHLPSLHVLPWVLVLRGLRRWIQVSLSCELLTHKPWPSPVSRGTSVGCDLLTCRMLTRGRGEVRRCGVLEGDVLGLGAGLRLAAGAKGRCLGDGATCRHKAWSVVDRLAQPVSLLGRFLRVGRAVKAGVRSLVLRLLL